MDGKKHDNCDQFIMYKKDFPGGAVVKNLPASAETQVRSLVLVVALEQLSPCIAITEPVHSRVLAPQQEKPPEKPTHHKDSSPHSQQWRQSTAKNK